ncbi:ATP phosphoribosyltransferase [Paenibacillus sp. PR3]|uniref:ATP phosphoribosyltransferase n=1 Tax=Paenibacillus terricola TaxID=2763503 RepID=A0ABR8N2W9_9BACL|nr:ATP phosphoribosyltransferase [Paenibacillus terricola]MBD3922498.1 ATP phosphoribosyltransferase [Paenibacillus terricola]
MQSQLRIAVPKGNNDVSHLFKQAGYPLPEGLDNSRKYIIPIPCTNLTFILAKAIDIPTIVAYGAADVGIVGKEMLLENPRDVYELLDLAITEGTIAVIGKPGHAKVNPQVATPYSSITAAYYKNKGQQAEIIPLNGSLELAISSGFVDCIVDLDDSIYVWEDAGLTLLDTIHRVSSRLIANCASYMLRGDEIKLLCDRLSSTISSMAALEERTIAHILLEERPSLGEKEL